MNENDETRERNKQTNVIKKIVINCNIKMRIVRNVA